MDVLGLNAFHAGSSAALVRDGRVVAAAEEERFNHIKHSAGFPFDAVKYCLRQAGLDIRKLDLIAVSSKPIENVREEILQILAGRPAYSRQIKKRLEAVAKFRDVRRLLAQDFGVPENTLPPVKEVPHQLSHIAGAYFQSGFSNQDGETALLSIDRFGDFSSTLLARANGKDIEIVDEVLFPHSIGILYTMVTQFCGFNRYGDGGKMMGLAAYGEPVYAERLRQIIKLPLDGLFELDPEYFTHPVYGLDMIWEGAQPVVEDIFSEKMIETFGPPRHRYANLTVRERDLAASLQLVVEEAILHVMNRLADEVPSKRLAYSGAVALNCVANRRILEQSPFEDIYIPSAPNHAGTAIGCALYASAEDPDTQFPKQVESCYTGPSFSTAEIEKALESSGLHYRRSENIAEETAELIVQGQIVGWFHGRMEFGPRALGSRSILGDPRSEQMRSLINSRVKFREDYRPFAASILSEHQAEWFTRAIDSPFMLFALKPKDEHKDKIPAVIHKDGSCRVHTVQSSQAPSFHSLIQAFYEKTGIPVVLNTSFNENEPIACSPEDAIHVFNNTHLDVLVMEDFIVTR